MRLMEDRPEIKVPFARVDASGNEYQYLKEVLESGWLTTGRFAGMLEEQFTGIIGARHGLAVNSCTSALHLALEALGAGPGTKILVPTMTFTATAEVARYLGANPVLLDVDPTSGLLTPEIVEKGLESNPDAGILMVVHFGGHPAAMLDSDSGRGILQLCRARGVRIIEDAAHAFPARIGDSMIGTIGDVTCFSFYANKTMTTGEGGMVTTEDDTLAERMRTMRLHGIDRDAWHRFSRPGAGWEYDIIAPGYKYNMPDTAAAIGLAQLERHQQMHERRIELATRYMSELQQLVGLGLPACTVPRSDHAWHIFPVMLDPEAPVDTDQLISEMNQRGVATSVHYKPLHRMSYWRQECRLDEAHDARDFPGAEARWRGSVTIPLFSSMTDGEQQHVIDTLEAILEAPTAC